MEHTTVLIGNQGECMKVSEKRFIIVKSIENLYAIVDKERADKEQILILSLHKEQVGVVCDLLNEEQARIRELEEEKMELEKKLEFKTLKQEERDKQIEEDYARLQRRKILERSGNCESLTLKYNPNTTYMG